MRNIDFNDQILAYQIHDEIDFQEYLDDPNWNIWVTVIQISQIFPLHDHLLSSIRN